MQQKLKNVLCKEAIQAHEIFWTTALSVPKHIANKSVNGKWSAAQNVEHINKVIESFARYLLAAKNKLEAMFGLSEAASRDETEMIYFLSNAVAKGLKAPAIVTPQENATQDISELILSGEKLLQSIESSLDNWTEEELDKYLFPHPLLGKITVREMLYVIIFHVNHHHQTVKSILVNSFI